VDEIAGLVAKGKTRVPIFALPELAVLAKPTAGEIAEDLGATRWSGDPESFNREVDDIKIGAMELPNFLDRLVEGTLVITPETDLTSSWEASWPTPPAPTPGSQGSF